MEILIFQLKSKAGLLASKWQIAIFTSQLQNLNQPERLFQLHVLNQMSFEYHPSPHPPILPNEHFHYVSSINFKGLAKYRMSLIAVIDLCPLLRY